MTPESQFGSSLELTNLQLRRIVKKTGIIDEVVAMQENQMDKDLDRAAKRIYATGNRRHGALGSDLLHCLRRPNA